MAKTKHARIAIDAALCITYVTVIATALVQEAPHEYLGIALFVLVVTHVVLNRRWFAHLARGDYDAVRVLRTVAILGVLACTAAQAASSVVLSKHAFSFLPAIPGTFLARRVHMLCSYWGFVFAFMHAGLQAQGMLRMLRLGPRNKPSPLIIWAARTVLATVALYGAYSFVRLNLLAYLTGQVQFTFVDFDTPLVLSLAQYGAIAALIAGTFHCLRQALGK